MRRQTVNRSQLPPGPRLPGAIQLLATWTRPASTLEQMRRSYGKRVTVKLPFQPPFVILSDPEEIKQLFIAPPEVLHPGEGARVLEPMIGRNSVILLDENPHMEQRKLLLPAFHGEKVAGLTGLMEELARREIESWPTGQPIRLHPRLQRLTLEIILRAVFGLEQGARLERLRDILTGVLVFSESPLSVLPAAQKLARWVPPLKRFQALIAQADELIFDLIDERKAANDERDDVLGMLLEARHEDGSPMSAQELRDELMTALVAGHETTASQLAWGFEQLAREPRVARRLAQDGEEYVTATIYEILRLRPVLPNAEPRLTKQPIRIGPFEYPPGVALLASGFLVHHDPEIYPEPYAFRPERFLGQQPGTYTWIPFGGGRRRCIGASFALQEMKIVIRAVVRRYELEPLARRPEGTGRRSITFSPRRGAMVILHERTAPTSTEAAGLLTAA